jgi:hypothetical protein
VCQIIKLQRWPVMGDWPQALQTTNSTTQIVTKGGRLGEGLRPVPTRPTSCDLMTTQGFLFRMARRGFTRPPSALCKARAAEESGLKRKEMAGGNSDWFEYSYGNLDDGTSTCVSAGRAEPHQRVVWLFFF